MKKRLDILLVESGQCSSRTKAQDLIRSGSVFYEENGKWVKAKSPSQNFEIAPSLKIENEELNRYVSRGGLKLEGALKALELKVTDLEVLDVGLSTGGFTDCLLKQGAAKVTGVDVGHGQLHSSLQKNPRIISLEGVNARELDQNSEVLAQMPAAGWPLIVVDVSFISLTLVLPALKKVLKPDGFILALVKPQFEVGPEGLGKGGVVKDPALYTQVENKIRQKCLELDLTVRDYLDSPIEGKDGNKEFFIFTQKK